MYKKRGAEMDDNEEFNVNGHTVDEVWLLMLDENIDAYEKCEGLSAAYWISQEDKRVQLHVELEGRGDNPRIAPTFDFLKWSKARVKAAMLEVKAQMEESGGKDEG